MKFTLAATAALSALSSVAAQRPTNTSICDYYTSALLMSNTAENQFTLLKLLVNTAVIGNYTTPNMNAVPGILAPGSINGTAVNLAPFFTGAAGRTSNRNGTAVSLNFLDGGGATPLLQNDLPTDDSNQYYLLTHLYQYFGYLLGCSMQGMEGFSSYEGQTSMFAVHKYMYITNAQNTYFIQQVGLAAQSFGVANDDVTAVANSLDAAFNFRCLPAASIPSNATAAPQSICIADDCTKAANASCALYQQTREAGVGPNGTVLNAGNITLAAASSGASGSARASGGSSSGGSSSGSGSGSGSGTSDSTTLAAAGSFVGIMALAAAFI